MKYLSLFTGIGGFELGIQQAYVDISRTKERKIQGEDVESLPNISGEDGDGRTFEIIICTLWDLGYDLQWQVLNSKNHGVPQNRERVFIVGNLRGTPRPKVFPFGGTDSKATGEIAVEGYLSSEKWDKFNESSRRVYSSEGISPTIPTIPTVAGGGQTPKIVTPVLTPDRLEKRQNGRRFKEDGDDSFTLTAQDRHGIYNGASIRRLTPLECERLQGFPDGWTEGISDSQRYKVLGNAVSVPVVEHIVKYLLM